MIVHWQQFSPGEKDALLRHFVLHTQRASVTAEKVCKVMQQTHFFTCVSPAGGRTLVEFVSGKPGAKPGAAIAEDLTEGIYQAALRAYGVELADERKPKSKATRKAGNHRHV
jgi:hypothetical protein